MIRNIPRIKKLIIELNTIAEQRKTLIDQMWVTENHAETLRTELMQLLDHNKEQEP